MESWLTKRIEFENWSRANSSMISRSVLEGLLMSLVTFRSLGRLDQAFK